MDNHNLKEEDNAYHDVKDNNKEEGKLKWECKINKKDWTGMRRNVRSIERSTRRNSISTRSKRRVRILSGRYMSTSSRRRKRKMPMDLTWG